MFQKYNCSYTFSEYDLTYFVDVVAESETHAKEIASNCVREKSIFGKNVEPYKWNVMLSPDNRSTNYGDSARVLDYRKV